MKVKKNIRLAFSTTTLTYPIRNVDFSLVRNEFQDARMSGSTALGIGQLEQHWIFDI